MGQSKRDQDIAFKETICSPGRACPQTETEFIQKQAGMQLSLVREGERAGAQLALRQRQVAGQEPINSRGF